MPRVNQKYAILLQKVNGGSPKLVFEITESKALKILDLIEPEIKKTKGKYRSSPITIDMFYKQETTTE